MTYNLVGYFQNNGYDIEEYSFKESAIHAKKWKERFASPKVHGCVWEVFENDENWLQREDAVNKFIKLPVQEFYVLPSFEYKPHLLKCSKGQMIDFSDYGDDLYVFSTDYEWTMIYTHEQQAMALGSYFSL